MSDLTDGAGKSVAVGGHPVCKQISLNTTTNILEEKKSYCLYANEVCSYNLSGVTPVALSSSGFTITSLKFSMDGVGSGNSAVMMKTTQKPLLLANANKNYLGNIALAFKDFIQLAQMNSPMPSPIQSPTPVLGCTNPNAINYNPLATQNDGSCILQSCVTADNCDFGFVCNSNGYCIDPNNVFLPTTGTCGTAATGGKVFLRLQPVIFVVIIQLHP